MDWKYLGNTFTVPRINAIGFIYLIEFADGTKYIGKKNFYQNRRRNFGKKELALITDKRKKKYEVVTKESDWRSYVSSNPIVKEKVRNDEIYVKHIVSFATCKKELTYLEEAALYRHNVLSDDLYLNDNIAGRFFTKDAKEWESKKSLV